MNGIKPYNTYCPLHAIRHVKRHHHKAQKSPSRYPRDHRLRKVVHAHEKMLFQKCSDPLTILFISQLTLALPCLAPWTFSFQAALGLSPGTSHRLIYC